MISDRPRDPGSGTPPPASTRALGRLQTGVRGLIVVVACCGVMSWAARHLLGEPAPGNRRRAGLRSPNPSVRARAARELWWVGMKEPGVAIPALIDAMTDPEAPVRLAVVEALGSISGDAARVGAAGEVIREAITALIRSLGDREPSVRLAALMGLKAIVSAKGADASIDLPSGRRRLRRDAGRSGRWAPAGGTAGACANAARSSRPTRRPHSPGRWRTDRRGLERRPSRP